SAGAQPVIDCQGKGRAFYFGSGETEDSVIDNFTIRNGKVSETYGGAVVCKNNSSPTIMNCVFENNKAEETNRSYNLEDGGAIYCAESSPRIYECRFISNSVTGGFGCGGAIYCGSSSKPILRGCVFSGNSAGSGGAVGWVSTSSGITNCAFSGNSAKWYGGALFCSGRGSPILSNCTFSGNSAGKYGGAICCWSSTTATLNNCIMWGDSVSGNASEIYIYDSSASCTLDHCCVDDTGYGGQTGNITENNCIHQNPQFVDPANGDYHLKDTSPCIDAGDNSLVPSNVDRDLDGNQRIVDGDNDGTATVDIGAYEYQP
ncbi:MAG: hypothetical protein DRP63_01110, partial [Planctomycetota bacterium]